MSLDCEAMRFVAQALEEVEHRIARLERERRPARHEEALATGVAQRYELVAEQYKAAPAVTPSARYV